MGRGGRREGAGRKKKPENERTKHYNFTMIPEVYDKLKEIAVKNNTSVGKTIEKLLNLYLELGNEYKNL